MRNYLYNDIVNTMLLEQIERLEESSLFGVLSAHGLLWDGMCMLNSEISNQKSSV